MEKYERCYCCKRVIRMDIGIYGTREGYWNVDLAQEPIPVCYDCERVHEQNQQVLNFKQRIQNLQEKEPFRMATRF